MNTENFLKLATKLDTVPQEEFHMEIYRGILSKSGVPLHRRFRSPSDCGTVGCALGHAPLTPGLETIPLDFPIHYILGEPQGRQLEWDSYALRIFGISPESDAGAFIFSSGWTPVDNTPQGAAARIRYLLKHGLPEGWDHDFTPEIVDIYDYDLV